MKFKSIQEARTELGFTQSDMADQLGVTRQTYAKMEQHPEELTIKDARLICSILGKKCEDIFFASMVN
jgi:DNA-binding XRE family transcriptional regulator